MPSFLLLTLVFALLVGSIQADPSWNQFRGPSGTGVVNSSAPLPTRENAVWTTPIPKGLSSPVLSGERIFLTGVENDRLLTICLDHENGEILWKREAPKVELEKVHTTGSPAASTPFASKERVHVYFGSYGLITYDHLGTELWKKPIPTPRSLYGMTTSPIVHGGLLYLVLDDENNLPDSKLSRSRVIAFDPATGEQKWETGRPFVRSGWSTPVIWHQENKQPELVVLGTYRVTGYDAASGEEKWFATGYSKETISIPAVGSKHLYVSSSQLGGGGDVEVDPQPFWDAMLHFDKNEDGKIAKEEIDENFTFPIRPELEPGHPGFGLPLPKDQKKRDERQNGIFGWMDRNQDEHWDETEFKNAMNDRNRRNRPLLAAIRPDGRGNITETHVDWEVNRGIPEIPSPLYHEGLIYLVRNGGMFGVIDTESGELVVRERLEAGGMYSASPVLAGDHVYLISERGELTVVKAGRELEILHQHNLGEPCRVTPALDRDTLYLRTERHLRAHR